ncbi:hypothetical protein BKA82DRAFT_2853056 [Pisolithus tinctorius]|nr:hypothetical protein BKA82DRAFT_2853056 [Pisolithus tinctorius]
MLPAETAHTPLFTPTPGPSEPTPTTQAQNLFNPSTRTEPNALFRFPKMRFASPSWKWYLIPACFPPRPHILIRSHRLGLSQPTPPHRCRTRCLIPPYFPPHHPILIPHQRLDHPSRYRPYRRRPAHPAHPSTPCSVRRRTRGRQAPVSPDGKASNTDPRTGSLKTGRLSVPLLLVRCHLAVTSI